MSYLPRVVPRHETLLLNGLEHRLLRWGPVERPPVLLLHGFQDSAETFQLLVDALPADWHCVGLDWRGFGGSAAANRPYWFPEYYADLEHVLDVLSPERGARIVGHSMGGNIALHYAGIRPQRIEWLVSLEGFGLPRTTAEQAPERYARWLDELRAEQEIRRYPSIAHLATALRRRNARLRPEVAEFLARAWSRPLTDASDGEVQLRHDPWHRLINPVLSRREESEACWRRIVAPVLMLIAEQSEFRPRLAREGSADYLKSVLPTATVMTIAGVGHGLHYEDPAAVASAILQWLPS